MPALSRSFQRFPCVRVGQREPAHTANENTSGRRITERENDRSDSCAYGEYLCLLGTVPGEYRGANQPVLKLSSGSHCYPSIHSLRWSWEVRCGCRVGTPLLLVVSRFALQKACLCNAREWSAFNGITLERVGGRNMTSVMGLLQDITRVFWLDEKPF
ncbi:hypothetical protein CTAM01_01291 [Colletotrichum tamarilloi]|uniref:Uncharacterized protein n=1 Tax=Colletotrichum tamarilloi TaxID=1209934 RepID=A0ABQ9RRZ8_9PEZI|nr:uncharacterized protein CTAM01_01291 [Colletotrichum tamarilloi]KAK1510718.1 hypothetical protein CTAM01_01291 [Colletotrichum tamarilloi]